MAKFDYKKWIAENKHGKNNTWEKLYEQGVADFEVKEQTTSGSGTTGGSTGSGTTGGSTGSGTTGGSTGSGTTGGSTGSGTTGGSTGSGTTGSTTGSSGCANISYTAECADNPGGSNNTQHNDGCSTIDGSMPDSTHVGSYATRGGSSTIWKITVIGAQNTTNNGHAYTSAGCTGGNTPSGSNSSGSAGGMQNGNYYGLPAGQQPCTFSYSGVAAQTYLNTGNAPSWNTWLNKRNTGYNNVGCRHFTNVTKWISNQLASGVNAAGNPWNPIQVARKNEKIAWANSMWDNCQCTQPGGSLPEELGRTYKINENKINLRKKFTKNKLKNIIREELKSSLLNEQYSGEGCESYLATTTPECQKCTSSQPTPYIPPAFGANNTGPQCQCCDDERVRDPHTGDKPNCNPELQHLDNYGIDCWWCPHEQVGGSSSCAVITSSTLSLALSSGQTLHTDSTLCAADTTTPCGEHSGGDDLDCQCCNGQFGQSMSPIPASTPGGCSSLNGYPLHSCSTQGTPLKCKKPPTRGGSEEPVGHTVGESQRLREEIQKELFGKK